MPQDDDKHMWKDGRDLKDERRWGAIDLPPRIELDLGTPRRLSEETCHFEGQTEVDLATLRPISEERSTFPDHTSGWYPSGDNEDLEAIISSYNARSSPKNCLGKWQIVLIMIAFCIGGLLTALDGTMVSTALPVIQQDLAASSTQYSWIGSAYLLSGASLLCLWGPVSDIVGRKWVLVGGMAVFAAGNVMAALAQKPIILIVGRAVQGVGGLAFSVVLNIALADMFSLRDRAMYVAYYSISAALGASLGPVFSGILTEYLEWRYCFWIMVPIAVVALVLTVVFFPANLPERRGAAGGLRSLDYPGVFLVTSGTLLLLLGLQFGGINYPWDSGTVITLLGCGSGQLFAFILLQGSVPKPIMPVHLFKNRSRAACFIIDFSHGFVYIGCLFYLPVYFSLILDASSVQVGLWLLLTALPCAVAAAIVAWSVKKTGHYRIAIIMSTASLTLATGLFIDFPEYRSWPRIVCFQLLLSVGIGSLHQVPLLVMQATVHAKDITSANATFIFIRTLSSAISIVGGQVLLQNEVKKHAAALLRGGVPPAVVSVLPTHLDVLKVAKGLTAAQEDLLKQAITESLSRVWILYTAVAGVGVLASLFMQHHDLTPARRESRMIL